MPPTETVRPIAFDANLRRLEGKKGLVIGIANENSIAWGCARAFRSFGAELAITYLNEKAKPYVEPLARALEAPVLMTCAFQSARIESICRARAPRWLPWPERRLIHSTRRPRFPETVSPCSPARSCRRPEHR